MSQIGHWLKGYYRYFGGCLIAFILGTSLVLPFFDKRNWLASGAGENWAPSLTDWGYRKLITVNASKVSVTQTNFPVLVYRASDTDLADDAKCQNDGDDICFVLYSDNSTQLNHEIESFYGSTGELWAWVNVTSLSGTSDTKIWMYYGNSGCSSQQHVTDTWDGYYKMVLHLNETSGIYYDSTVNDNDGHDNLLESRSNAAKVGKACPSFDGSANGYIAVWADSSQNFPNDLSIEMYVSFDATGEQCPIAKDVNALNGWAVEHYPANDMLFQKGEGASPYTTTSTNPFASTGTWYWAAWTFDDATETTNKFYCNGVQHAATGSHSASHWSDATSQPVYIGLKRPGNSTTYSYKMNGKVDEVRLSNTVRSLSWIYACYNTTNSPTSFHYFGAEESGGGGWSNSNPVNSNPVPANTATDVSLSLTSLNITVNDLNCANQTMNITFLTNESGSWQIAQNTNTSITNGTYRCLNVSWVDSYDTKYWWNVSTNDGCGGWDNDTYYFTTEEEEVEITPQYRLITINHSQVNDDLVNFPVLVKLIDDANLSVFAQADGDDIQFWSYDNITQYHHEIESYDGDGTLYAWVNITWIDSDADTYFWMKYGNETMTNQEDVPGTWNSNYLSVHHFNESSGKLYDATSYGNDSTAQAGISYGVSGLIGDCVEWDGTDSDYIQFTNFSGGREEICIEVWIRPDEWVENNVIYDEFDPATNPFWEFTLSMDVNSHGFMTRHGTYNQSARDNDIYFSPALGVGSWHHIVMWYSVANANKRLYVNGSIDSSTATNTSLPITPASGRDSRSSRLGWSSDTTYFDYDGEMDEFRVSKVAWNTSWLNATFHTISDDDFLTIGDASEQPTITQVTVTTNSTSDVTNITAKLWGYLQEDGGENCNVWFEWDDYNITQECGGFIATGTVCADGRSLLMKNRHGVEGTQKVRFFQGDNYTFLAVGYADFPNAGYCRQGINEKGLIVANFDASETLDSANIQSDKSYGEDAGMASILGNFSTVAEAAWWLAQHSSYDAQTGIISMEEGVGAIVQVDSGHDPESYISWINDTWAPIVNAYYIEDSGVDATKKARTEYIANRVLAGNGLDPDEPDKFCVSDIILMSKDINSTNDDLGYYASEPLPGSYTGTYANSNLMADTSVSTIIGVSGNESYDGALNLAWICNGYSPHVGVSLPVSACYVDAENDVLSNLTSSSFMDAVHVKENYVDDGGNDYERQKVHEIWNFTRPLENMTVDEYDVLMDTIMTCANASEAQDRMRDYCNTTALKALVAYEGNTTWMSTNESKDTGISEGTEFNQSISGLTPGTVYYYRAWANNSLYTDSGDVLKFMTLPDKPYDVGNSSYGDDYINLTWIKGAGAHCTVIEWNTAADWARGAGNEIYNGTGSYYNHSSIDGTYYYQFWSYVSAEGCRQYSALNETYSYVTPMNWQQIQDWNVTLCNLSIAPVLSDESPSDEETGVSIPPDNFTITVNDQNGDMMNIAWLTNASGSWVVFNTTQGIGTERVAIFTQDFEDCNLMNNWSLDETGRNTSSTGTYEIQNTDTGSYDNDINAAHSGSYFACGRGGITPSTLRRAYNRTSIDISDYTDVNISVWVTYEDTEIDDFFEFVYYNESSSSWVDIVNITGTTYGNWQSWSGGSWQHAEIQIPDAYKPDDLILEFRWRTSADQERIAIDDLNVTGVSSVGAGVPNGTYSAYNTSWVTESDTKYWWSVNCTDGLEWTNETYCFTTTSILNWQQLQNWNITLQNLSLDWNQLQEYNITLQNLTLDWGQIQEINITLSNLSLDWGQIQEINITLQNTSSYVQVSDWNITLNNVTLGWGELQGWNITLSNDEEFVWYHNTADNAYFTIGDLVFDPIVIEVEYVMFNTTDFKVTGENRTNVTINFINTTIIGAGEDDLLVDFSVHNAGDETVYFNISGFDPGATYDIKRDGGVFDSDTANASGDIQFTDVFSDVTYRYTIYLASGAPAEWQQVQGWNITLSNLSLAWDHLQDINITLRNTSGFVQIADWNITLSNLTLDWSQIQDMNITLTNGTFSWVEQQDYNITIQNLSLNWVQLQEYNITLQNTSSSEPVATWNITICNLTLAWMLLQDYNITLSNTVSQQQLQDWNLTLQNTSDVQQISLWNITLQNHLGWIQQQDMNITLSNTSVYNTIQDMNITIQNHLSWIQQQEYNITLTNTSESLSLQEINITLQNLSLNWVQQQEYNVTLSNLTLGWLSLHEYNITLQNTSASLAIQEMNITVQNLSLDWNLIQEYNITLSNLSLGWNQLQDMNITLSNLSLIWTLLQECNITLQNLSLDWNQLQEYNITLQNLTLGWGILQEYNLTLSNLSAYEAIQTMNMTLQNQSLDWIAQQTWNVTLCNSSLIDWVPLTIWNISLQNTSTVQQLQDYNITLCNLSLDWVQLQGMNITLTNGLSWQQLQEYNITLQNSLNWLPIQEINITLSNASLQYHLQQEWNITIHGVSSFVQLQDWNLTLQNTSGWTQQQEWNLTLRNTTAESSIQTWNITLQNLSFTWVQQQEWNLTLRNTSGFIQILDINITLRNISSISQLQDWNLTLQNTTMEQQLQDWNITLTAITSFTQVQDWNITIQNTSASINIDDWNLTLVNTTLDWGLLQDWEVTIRNTDSGGPGYSWHTLQTWNITICNLVDTLMDWNITLRNSSLLEGNITITFISPNNTTVPINQIILRVGVEQEHGYPMNLTWSWNNSGSWEELANQTGVHNGTYGYYPSVFTFINTTYQWRMHVNSSGSDDETRTCVFSTAQALSPPGFSFGTQNYLSVLGVFGILGFLFALIRGKKRRR